MPDIDVLAELRAWFEPLLKLLGHSSPRASAIRSSSRSPATPTLPPGDPRRADESVVIDFVDRVVRRRRRRDAAATVSASPARSSSAHRRPRVDWVNTLFLSLSVRGAPRRPVQRVPLHVLQVPGALERLEYAEGWYAERGTTTPRR